MWFPAQRAGQTPTAKERFDELEPLNEEPLERLRFFLSLALKGQDWLDVEPFLAAIAAPLEPAAKVLTDEVIERLAVEHESFGFGVVDDRGLTTHGFDPEGLRAFARDLVAAATTGNKGAAS
jgi:hypothetical protein